MDTYRPERHRQKRYKKQIVRNIFILIVLVALLATLGIKVLINLSLFIADFGKDNTFNDNQNKSNNQKEHFFTPKLYDVPDATNSASIVVNGTATADKPIKIYVNDDIEQELVPQQDEFEVTLRLKEGKNVIRVDVQDAENKKIKSSREYSVLYLSQKPNLAINSPTDGQTVDKAEILITGHTDTDTLIKIQSLPVVVDSEGNFSYHLNLKDGENKITIVAEDVAGNTNEQTITVRYQREDE